LSWILLILALVLHKKAGIRNGLIIAALAILGLGSTSLVANGLAKSLEWRYLPPKNIPAADAIVVLGGGTEANLYPRSSVEVNGAGDRVLYAAQLYKEGKAAHILLSGGEISWLNDTSSTPAQEMAIILKNMGVREDALWLDTQSQNTYENAYYSAMMLKERNIHKVLLITSAMHMPRAVALFEKQGIGVIPVPVDYSITQSDQSENDRDWLGQLLGFLPSAGNLASTTNALKEYIGIFTYWLRGWL
jgi:uncharacterized SAM-binding protein YcdF (DUF218 family)